MAKEKIKQLFGKKAPLFTLLDHNGKKVSLKSILEKRKVLLYFYPRASTPGCTTQACGLRDQFDLLKKRKVTVLGISPDQPEKILKFVEKYDLNFPLLSDPDHNIADKYGVWGEKKFMGKTYMGIIRTTFLIDQTGKITHIMDKVKTKTHHEDVLEFL